MKKNRILQGLILAICFSFIACEEEVVKPPITVTNDEKINKWIYKDVMNKYYFWNEKLPKSPNYKMAPNEFFDLICYWYDKNTNPEGDRFSWIQENYVDLLNSLSGVSSDEIGFEYMLYYVSGSQTNVFGEVQYVKKGTSAEEKGLKRGQTFTKINAETITVNNYRTLLRNLKGNYTLTVSDPVVIGGAVSSFQNEHELALSTLSQYAENPIYLDTVYTDMNGKNIGYLVYNFFADDSGDKTYGYDAQLVQIFSKFKTKNVTDLILDLRYNSGGSVLSAVCLAGMIVKGLNTKDIFFRVEYNKSYTESIRSQVPDDFFYQLFIDKIEPNKNNNLTAPIILVNIGDNLQNFYVLTGRNTASASELIINGLLPYMNITLVGDTTVGKNVASTSFYEENNPKNKWGLQPIIAKLYNKKNESNFTAGFFPNYLNRDRAMPKKELGDLNENMLREAVSYIAGGTRSFMQVQPISNKRIISSAEQKAWSNNMILNFQPFFNSNNR